MSIYAFVNSETGFEPPGRFKDIVVARAWPLGVGQFGGPAAGSAVRLRLTGVGRHTFAATPPVAMAKHRDETILM